MVVNYPYDNNVQKQSVDTPTPDDDIVRELSLEYSEDNFPMYNGSWPMGITNGSTTMSWAGMPKSAARSTIFLATAKRTSGSSEMLDK